MSITVFTAVGFSLYHGTQSLSGAATNSSGNSPWALATLLVIVALVGIGFYILWRKLKPAF